MKSLKRLQRNSVEALFPVLYYHHYYYYNYYYAQHILTYSVIKYATH
jgi:hypothetical protein